MTDLPKTFDGHTLGDFVVGDIGIARITKVDEYAAYTSEVVLTKEAFIEAYNKYIKDEAVERPEGEYESTSSQTKWVKIFENPYTNGYKCPFCGHKIQVTEQFLPQVTECEACGEDMRGDAE